MAQKRMFSKQITDSDAFIEMPLSTQCLYFHLGMQADDDGFINAPKRIQRVIGASDDDLKLLIAKKFIIPFESGVVVQKHWHINNNIRSDRYKETVYLEEKSLLESKPNGAYTLVGLSGGIPMVSIEQNRLDKNRLNKSCCLLNRMTEEESEKLFAIFEDADLLIDEVEAEVYRKGAVVEKPYQYVVGYARNKGWQERR